MLTVSTVICDENYTGPDLYDRDIMIDLIFNGPILRVAEINYRHACEHRKSSHHL